MKHWLRRTTAMKYRSTRDAGDSSSSGGGPKLYSFRDALLGGYAPDGGLYVPESLPTVTAGTLQEWAKITSYAELAMRVLRMFIGEDELPNEDLEGIIRSAFSGFPEPDAVPVVELWPKRKAEQEEKEEEPKQQYPDAYVAELFHGPTFCFKDLGMRVVVFLLQYFASRSDPPIGKVTLLVSTTGDTGPAAVQSIRDVNRRQEEKDGDGHKKSTRMSILVHFPKGQISDFQRKQLTTDDREAADPLNLLDDVAKDEAMPKPMKKALTAASNVVHAVSDAVEHGMNNINDIATSSNTNGDNGNNGLVSSSPVKVVAFEGGGDDMDAPIKRILNDYKKSSKRLVCGVNSYNIGRPLMQMVHYIWTYLRVVEKRGITPGDKDSPIDIVLPTGAMGNIAGGYMSKKMGIPIGKLCSGVNMNDVTHRVLQTGIFGYPPGAYDRMYETLSEAINVQLPYNFERLLFYLTDSDAGLVNQWYKTLAENRYFELPLEWHQRLQSEFTSARVPDDRLCAIMVWTLQKYGYHADPHTGVALAAADSLGYIDIEPISEDHADEEPSHPNLSVPFAILATASPCKFENAVTVALGKSRWEAFVASDQFPEAARSIMLRHETPPIVYKALPDDDLETTQKKWEKRARDLIETL